MKPRSLASPIAEFAFPRHKITFLSGPRQCGKTVLSKALLAQRKYGAYHNWDQLGFRKLWATHPSSLVLPVQGGKVPLVILDEIHKDRLWKRNLKGVYDTLETPCDFLVTGSAKLNVYMKGSDSLFGRHLRFRLHPFSIREMRRPDVTAPDATLLNLTNRSMHKPASCEHDLSSLLTYGPFPEPLFGQNIKDTRIWRQSRDKVVIREDLRDVSHLLDLGRIELMISLLPQRVGGPFSLASIAQDMEISIPTAKRWMEYLRMLYYTFQIRPYRTRIARSIRREGKMYLWDYAVVPDPAARFENLVGSHLLKACHFWSDSGEGDFELFFIRNKDQQEIDFLIVRDGTPWLPVEVKLNETEPSGVWAKFLDMLPCKFGLQLVLKPHWKLHTFDNRQVLVAGAAEALNYFV